MLPIDKKLGWSFLSGLLFSTALGAALPVQSARAQPKYRNLLAGSNCWATPAPNGNPPTNVTSIVGVSGGIKGVSVISFLICPIPTDSNFDHSEIQEVRVSVRRATAASAWFDLQARVCTQSYNSDTVSCSNPKSPAADLNVDEKLYFGGADLAPLANSSNGAYVVVSLQPNDVVRSYRVDRF